MEQKKWWETAEPMIISAVQCNFGENSYDILRRHTVGRGFNTEQLYHLTASGSMSYYNEEKDGAALDEYLKEAHKCGIREIQYINVHCIPQEEYEKHTDWVQMDKNGNEIMAYNVYYYLCVNGPWREYILEQIRGLCEHDTDGIFLDGPIMMQNGCFCEKCREKFKNKYGHSMYEGSAYERTEFNTASVTELMRDISGIVKKAGRDILLYVNNSSLRADITGCNTRRVYPYVDMLGTEGGFIWLNNKAPLWVISPMAKLLKSRSEGKPCVTFIAGDYKPWSYYMHTAAETKLFYAQALANGTNVWYGIHGPTKLMESGGGKAAAEMNAFIKKNADVFRDTKSTAVIAMLWSQSTANYYSSSFGQADFTEVLNGAVRENTGGDHYKAFMGFCDILMRGHVQFDVIDEENINCGELDKYELLIMPTCACMSAETSDEIHRFVQNGGNIISTFDTAAYDSKGEKLEECRLADIFGTEGICETVEYEEGTGYMKAEKSFFEKAELSGELIPAPYAAIRTSARKGAQVSAQYRMPMPGRYSKMPKESYPAIIENVFGKGRSIFMSGAVGELFCELKIPDISKILMYAVRSMARTRIKTDAPQSVEFVLREGGDCYFLHIINATGEMKRPIEKVIPIYDSKVSLEVSCPVGKIQSITGEEPAGVSVNGGEISFRLPVIKDYEILKINKLQE